MNIVFLSGRLSRPPESRTLPSGACLVAYDVTVERPDERAETVPVVWFDAPATAVEHVVDDRVVVLGRVRRRFFRTGGSTQSRTEVVAEAVVPVRHRKRSDRLRARAAAALAGAEDAPPDPLAGAATVAPSAVDLGEGRHDPRRRVAGARRNDAGTVAEDLAKGGSARPAASGRYSLPRY